MSNDQTARKIAVYIDLENIAIGVQEAKHKGFKVDMVFKRLVEKGDLIVKRAYADFTRFESYKHALHSQAVEMIDMPGSRMTGKNSSDIKMVVDALELCYTKPHVDAFALISGDSDFSPLVSKLRENNKHIIGVGVKRSTSSLLVDNCDEFLYYDDLVLTSPRTTVAGKSIGRLPKKQQEGFAQLLEAVAALQRENKELWASLVKDTMKRKQPQFNEEYHGYTTFGRMLEDAEKQGLLTLKKDPRSGTYVIAEVL